MRVNLHQYNGNIFCVSYRAFMRASPCGRRHARASLIDCSSRVKFVEYSFFAETTSLPSGSDTMAHRCVFWLLSLVHAEPIFTSEVGNMFNGPTPMAYPRWTAEQRAKYGPLFAMSMGPVSFVVGQDAQIANEIMVKNADKLWRRPFDAYTEIFSFKAISTSNEPTGIIFTD